MNFKKLSISVICFLLLVNNIKLDVFANVNLLGINNVPAKGVAVIDIESGRLLYGKNENKKMAMASTTKIMTALITLEQDGLDDYFEVDPDAIKVEGTSMGLLEGDMVSLRALAVGMLLPSGNDAAEVAAIRIAGSRDKFLKMMNERAEAIGCRNTHFSTTSGLDEDGHYTTPSDLAKIARCALNNSDFSEICSQQYKTIEYGNPPYKRTLKNHNKLLKQYENCVGIKTGFTDNAGRCLVSAAYKDGKGLIVVTLNSEDICQSHIDVYNQAFEKVLKYNSRVKLPVNNLKVVGGETVGVSIEKNLDAEILLVSGEESELKHKVKLKKFLFAPVKKGEVVGEIDYYIDNFKVATEPIITVTEVAVEEKKGFFKNILARFGKNFD